MTLEQQLRKARIEDNEGEISRLKSLIGGMTRNVTTETICNQSGNVIRVKQSFVVVSMEEQKETEEVYTII